MIIYASFGIECLVQSKATTKKAKQTAKHKATQRKTLVPMSDIFKKGSGRVQYNSYLTTKQIKRNHGTKQSNK